MSPNDARTYEAANKTMADLKSKYPGIDLTKRVSIGPREELKPFEEGKKPRTAEPGGLKTWEGKPSTQRTTEGAKGLKAWGGTAQTKEQPLKPWDERKVPPKVQRTYDEAFRTFHRIKNQYEKGSGPTVTFTAPNRMLGTGDTVSGKVVRAYTAPPSPITRSTKSRLIPNI